MKNAKKYHGNLLESFEWIHEHINLNQKFTISLACRELLFLDNEKIVLIPFLALKEATTTMALASMKVTTKYNHRPELTIIRSAQSHTDKTT
jgi:hypothetical protein